MQSGDLEDRRGFVRTLAFSVYGTQFPVRPITWPGNGVFLLGIAIIVGGRWIDIVASSIVRNFGILPGKPRRVSLLLFFKAGIRSFREKTGHISSASYLIVTFWYDTFQCNHKPKNREFLIGSHLVSENQLLYERWPICVQHLSYAEHLWIFAPTSIQTRNSFLLETLKLLIF